MTTAPRVGSPAERLTRRMFTRIITGVTRTIQEHELSVPQLAALYLLDERTTMRISELGGELGLTAPTTSRLVDDLVRQDLVERREDPTDRRARMLTLSAKGYTFVTKSSQARMESIAGAAAELPTSAIGALLKLVRND